MGKILASRTGDDTLRVLCCVLCVVCVVGVQCVCVCVLVLVLVCHADPSSSPPPPSPSSLPPHPPPHTHTPTSPLSHHSSPRVHVQNAPSVCTFKTSPCVSAPRPQVLHMRACCQYTRERFESRHGGRFESTQEGFSVPHHTARPHHDHKRHTHKTQQQPQQQHTETGTERDRERKRFGSIGLDGRMSIRHGMLAPTVSIWTQWAWSCRPLGRALEPPGGAGGPDSGCASAADRGRRSHDHS